MSRKFHPKDQLLRELVLWFEESVSNEDEAFIPEEEVEKLIEYYESIPNYEKAFLVVQRGIRLFPYSGGFHLKAAQLYFQVKEYENAWKAIEQAKIFDSRSADILLLQADLFCAEGRYDQAIRILHQLSKVVTPNELVDVWLEMADVYSMANRNDKLGVALQQVLKTKPLNEEALHRYWNHIIDTQTFEAGTDFLERIIDKEPYNFLAWYYLAKSYEEIGQYDQTIEAYQYSLAINSYYFAYWDFSLYLQANNKWDDAISVYHEMVEIFDQDTSIFIELAMCEKNKGNQGNAIEFLVIAQKKTDDKNKKANCEFTMATVYEHFKDYDFAIRHYKKALDLRPAKTKYWNNLSKCYVKLNRIEEASNCIKQSLLCNDEQPKQWLKLANCYYLLGRTDLVIETMQSAQKIFPNHTKLNYHYAAYLIQFDFLKPGLIQLEFALNIDASKKNYIFAIFPELKEQADVVQLCEQF